MEGEPGNVEQPRLYNFCYGPFVIRAFGKRDEIPKKATEYLRENNYFGVWRFDEQLFQHVEPTPDGESLETIPTHADTVLMQLSLPSNGSCTQRGEKLFDPGSDQGMLFRRIIGVSYVPDPHFSDTPASDSLQLL